MGAEQGQATEERSDTGIASAVALIFSAALSMQAVTLPLLALAAHYSKVEIGMLTAVSAVSQLLARLGTAGAMRRVTDRRVIVVACVTLSGSGVLLTFSTSMTVFVIAELIQGSGRGLFWTATQAHVVRSRRHAVGRLATVNFVSSFGQLGGPLIGGLLMLHSYAWSLDAAAGLGLAAAVTARVGLARLGLFSPAGAGGSRSVWSEPGVKVGCWAAVTAGSWRGLLNSYVPVALRSASESSVVVGLMLALANGANVAGAGLMGLLGERRIRTAFATGVLASGAGIAALSVAARNPVTAAAALLLSGTGAGMLQTLGPAAAATAVGKERRGDAVALAGGFRAAALFVSPMATAALLAAVALPPSLAVAGALLALPALTARGMHSRADRRDSPAPAPHGPAR